MDNSVASIQSSASDTNTIHTWTSGVLTNTSAKAAFGTLYPSKDNQSTPSKWKKEFEQASFIFMELNSTHAYLKELTGENFSYKVPVQYYYGSTEGTGCADYKIFLLGNENDSDALDSSVILHEYAHIIMGKLGKSPDNSGGAHSFGGPVTDSGNPPGCAYSEGWGTFFAQALIDDPV